MAECSLRALSSTLFEAPAPRGSNEQLRLSKGSCLAQESVIVRPSLIAYLEPS